MNMEFHGMTNISYDFHFILTMHFVNIVNIVYPYSQDFILGYSRLTPTES